MLYYILKYGANLLMRVYFSRVNVVGHENIPKDKPLVIAANHQSAFVEPVALGGYLPIQLHFITRGDVFVKRYMWFFKATNQVPIFRFRDGYKQMKKNMDSFKYVYEALDKGARVLIFCEGHMKWEKKLHGLQKGAARMAVGGYQSKPDGDIHVLPIGVNYEDHCTFRRRLDIAIGKPIRVGDFLENGQDERDAIQALTRELAVQLQPNVIDVKADENYEFGDLRSVMAINDAPRKLTLGVKRDRAEFEKLVDIANRTEDYDNNESSRNKIKDYVNALPGKSFKHEDYALVHLNRFGILSKLCFYLIALPLGLIGITLNFIPAYLTQFITNKTTKIPEFHASIKFGAGLILQFFYYIILFLVIGFSCCWILATGVIIAAMVFGLIGVYVWDRFPFYRAFSAISSLGKKRISELKDIRSHL